MKGNMIVYEKLLADFNVKNSRGNKLHRNSSMIREGT
jgi:hypothetical protein